MLPIPPSDGGGEGLDPRDEPHEEVDLAEDQRIENAGDPGEGRSQDEGAHDRGVDVDPHQGGDVLVFGDGPQGAPGPGALDIQVEDQHHQGGADDHQSVDLVDLERAERPAALQG